MEARFVRAAILAASALSLGASHRTPNFVIQAASAEFAEQVGREAERLRRELAIEWLGTPMPRWSQPCPITVRTGPGMGAGGATIFVFDHGEVFGWRMNIQGTPERVLDSVLPHEITHTVFASHFRQPLPRWADEGACTTVEHNSERRKQSRMLVDFLKSGRGIPFNHMFVMKEYPRDVLPLYAQGHSLATWLIHQGGKRKFIRFVEDGLRDENWKRAAREHYKISNLGELQTRWLVWVRQGSPAPNATDGGQALVAAPQATSDDNVGLLAATDSQSGGSPDDQASDIYRLASNRGRSPTTGTDELVPVVRPDSSKGKRSPTVQTLSAWPAEQSREAWPRAGFDATQGRPAEKISHANDQEPTDEVANADASLTDDLVPPAARRKSVYDVRGDLAARMTR